MGPRGLRRGCAVNRSPMPAFLRALPLPPRCLPAAAPRRRPRVTAALSAPELPRRAVLRSVAALASGALLDSSDARAYTLFWPSKSEKAAAQSGTTVFSVVPTSVADVNLLPVGIDEAVADASDSAALFLGEHHNSLVDHTLQARIIDALRGSRPVVVGLEMVQQRFQPALDRYVAGEISELDLYLATDWETRWVWPYELYLPVLRLCRKHRIPMVALSMDSETLGKLRADGGITNLSLDEFRAHIGNPAVFSEISKEPAFKAYISECITPSYASHYRMGLLRETANFNSFYTARVLRDEAMATRAVRIIRENPAATLVCLLGCDHVKFEYGVKARVQRQLQALAALDMAAKGGAGTGRPAQKPPSPPRLRSVMLNPGPADAYDPRDKSLKLEMLVNGNPIPIADYLWFSSVAVAKPRRRVKSRLLPPVERLTSL